MMNIRKYKSPQFTLALILILLIACSQNEGIIASSPQAKPVPRQTTKPKPSQPARREPLPFAEPKSIIGSPHSKKGGETRDASCPNDTKKPPLTFLTPKANMGLTVSDRPTFWFYSPYAANSQTRVVFEVIDSDEKQVFKQELEVVKTPGIIGVKLPQNTPALENNKSYDVILSINCASRIDIVRGRVKRVQANGEVTKQLQTNKGRDRAVVFGKNGFWFDMLTQLIELRRQNPQDEELKIDWEELLKLDVVDLGDITTESVVSCCNFK
jgi:Domain of Unknown Function (DUF928)